MKQYLIFIAIFLHVVHPKVLPDYIPQCKRTEPDFAKCVVDAIAFLKPNLLKGIPEIRVPAYDPLEIKNLTIDRSLPNLKVIFTYNNMKVYGPKDHIITNPKVDLDNLIGEMTVTVPVLRVTSAYNVTGKLLQLPLGGAGTLDGNFTNCVATAKGSAKIVMKDNVRYFLIDSFTVKTKVGGGRVKFVDSGPTALVAEMAALFFNTNPRLVLDIINPIVEEIMSTVFKEYVQNIFDFIPFDELIPGYF